MSQQGNNNTRVKPNKDSKTNKAPKTSYAQNEDGDSGKQFAPSRSMPKGRSLASRLLIPELAPHGFYLPLPGHIAWTAEAMRGPSHGIAGRIMQHIHGNHTLYHGRVWPRGRSPP